MCKKKIGHVFYNIYTDIKTTIVGLFCNIGEFPSN